MPADERAPRLGSALAPPLHSHPPIGATVRAGARKRLVDAPRQLRRARRVAVHADRVDAQRHLASAGGEDDAVAHHAHGAKHDRLGIVDDRAGTAARRQRGIFLVGAVREALRGDAKPRRSARFDHRGVREAEHDERRPARGDGAGDRGGQRRLARRHVVERAVRLDVLERRPFRLRDGRQRADLRDQRVLELRGIDVHLAPSESLQVREARMRADRDAGRARQAHGAPHHDGSPACAPQAMFAEVM